MNIEKRIKKLETYLAEDKRVVMYVAEDDKGGLFRYQCENVMDAMEESEKWRVMWFLKNELGEIEKYLDKVKIVVILRQTEKGEKLLNFIRKAREVGVRVLFCIDDLVFDYRDLGILMATVRERNFLYWLGYLWGVRRIAKRVDGFVVTNKFLGEKVKKSFGKPYVVIKNSLNEKQVRVAEKIVKEKGGERGNEEFRIGYFSGSPTHERDLMMIENDLLGIMAKYRDVVLVVVGYMRLHGEMKKMVDEGRVRLVPLVDYEELEKLMAEVDVNIAPLVVNEFTNCKSELKFFEAGVVETATIASPIYTFRQAIADGENGFLAERGEWYDKLEYLYRHREKNRKIAKKAREYALEHYYGKEFLKEVEAVYDYFLKG